ncbi:hypothetical protein B7494_g3318 [Chlorociboria aeruginascens]|nr:hypothetical protein B7494_g3318 [Chlorociboria aeruginascens]
MPNLVQIVEFGKVVTEIQDIACVVEANLLEERGVKLASRWTVLFTRRSSRSKGSDLGSLKSRGIFKCDITDVKAKRKRVLHTPEKDAILRKIKEVDGCS